MFLFFTGDLPGRSAHIILKGIGNMTLDENYDKKLFSIFQFHDMKVKERGRASAEFKGKVKVNEAIPGTID